MACIQSSMLKRTLNKHCWRRFNSSTCTCTFTSKTRPVEESSRVLRHLHFVKPFMPFKNGLDIQENIVRVQLDMKKLESTIKRQLAALHEQNMAINDQEQSIIDKIMELKPNPVILTFQFEPTYTGGKRIKKQITKEQISEFEDFKPSGVTDPSKFVQLERGGQITFHGPGQMVAYIILDLKSFHHFPPKCYVNGIEEAALNLLDGYGVKAQRTNDTGVWSCLNNGKLASIGVNVNRNITSHGICINVSPNLEYLNHFTLCGLPDAKATSIQEILKDTKPNVGSNLVEGDETNTPSVDDVASSFANHMAKILGIEKVERMLIESHKLE